MAVEHQKYRGSESMSGDGEGARGGVPFRRGGPEVPFVRSFVRSFFAGRGPAYSGPQRWDHYIGPMRQPRERRGIGRCVRCMRVVVVVVEMNII